MAGMGRPTRMTPAVVALVMEAARIGAPVATCAAHAGIGEATLWEWLQRGQTASRKDKRPTTQAHRDFAEAFRRAQEKGDLALIAKIRGSDDWKAAAHLLACRRPTEFSPRHIATLVGADGGAIKIQAVPGDEIPARDVVGSKVIEAAERFRAAG